MRCLVSRGADDKEKGGKPDHDVRCGSLHEIAEGAACKKADAAHDAAGNADGADDCKCFRDAFHGHASPESRFLAKMMALAEAVAVKETTS